MELKDYSTEELKDELKRRSDLAKAEKEKVKRCRMCIHYGEVNYYGKPTQSKTERSMSKCCQFFSWGINSKYKKCHAPSQLACEHFEEKEIKHDKRRSKTGSRDNDGLCRS